MTGPSGSLQKSASTIATNAPDAAEKARLCEEIKYLEDQITGLKSRIGSAGNATQRHNLGMLARLLERCNRSMAALQKRGAAA